MSVDAEFKKGFFVKLEWQYKKLINTMFQYTWSLVKRMYKSDFTIESTKNAMLAQFRLARIFKAIFRVETALIILGDSNAENLASVKYMKQFGNFGLAVNIAKSGTRGDGWVDFFNSNPDIASYIQESFAIVLFNIGGNHVLQGRMDLMKPSMEKLKALFPESFNCEIVPIDKDVISGFQGGNAKEIEDNIKLANTILYQVWEERLICIYDLFLDPSTIDNAVIDKPVMFLLGDLLHFSDVGNNFRIKLITASLVHFFLLYESPDLENLERNLARMYDEHGDDKETVDFIRMHHFYIHNKEECNAMLDRMKPKRKKSVKKKSKKKKK